MDNTGRCFPNSICIFFLKIFNSLELILAIFCPLKIISPFAEINYNIASTKEVFPDPDSPTIPKVCLIPKLKFNESTALT